MSNIGLRGVIDRISLIYGSEGSVCIDSVPQRGTIISIVIPATEGGK